MKNNTLSTSYPKGVLFEDVAKARAFVGSDAASLISPEGIARPTSEQEVKAVVDWANEHQLALVPLSSPGGKRRRGLSGLKQDRPIFILDMSQMRQVIHADGDDAIALIEPGVTFPEFDQELAKAGLRSVKPFLPRRTKSVLSCYLEREPTIHPSEHWDTTDPLASLSLVMGNGEKFRTGGASLYEDLQEGLDVGMRQMMASGPVGTDYTRVTLGSQGTLATVCWASIYCERIPKLEQAKLYGADSLQDLLSLSRHLALHQLGAQYFILSRTQLAAALAENNEKFTERANHSIPDWYLYVNVTAPDFLPEQGLQWQLADLEAFVNKLPVTLMTEAHPDLLSSLELRLKEPPETFYKDIPYGTHTDIFCLAQFSKVGELVAAAESILARNPEVSFGLYLQPTIQGTSCHIDVSLFHDDSQKTMAAEIEKELVKTLADRGGFFSRPYGNWAEDAFKRNETIVPQLQKVKNIFDPAGIMSPGKLCY